MEIETEEKEAEVVVIGGMVLDIHATLSTPAQPRTTTPGKVYFNLGGVARNVAECISKLGVKPYMISTMGFDMPGNLLMEHWNSARLPIKGIRRHQDIITPVVSNIIDRDGEVATGVASVDSVEMYLTPEWIQQFKDNIRSAPVLMVDANLSVRALEASCILAAEYNVPVWFEPVSLIKSRRITSIASYVTFVSPNEDELITMANALSGENIFEPIKLDENNFCREKVYQILIPAISVLLDKGIKIVIITLGANGVFLCAKEFPYFVKKSSSVNKDNEFCYFYERVASLCPPKRIKSCPHFAVHLPSLPASVVRLTGAGDCLVGGTIASLCSGLDVMQSLAVGVAAARASVESATNVPSVFDLYALSNIAVSAYTVANFLFHQSML